MDTELDDSGDEYGEDEGVMADEEEYADDFGPPPARSPIPAATSITESQYTEDWDRNEESRNEESVVQTTEKVDEEKPEKDDKIENLRLELSQVRKEGNDLKKEVKTVKEEQALPKNQSSSKQQKQEDIFLMTSSKLVKEAEKNAKLSEKLLRVKAELDRMKEDTAVARCTLIEKITQISKRSDDTAYKNVALWQLVALREKAIEAQRERSPPSALSSSMSPPQVIDKASELQSLRAKLTKAEEEKKALRLQIRSTACANDDVRALKQKIHDILQRGKNEKDMRAKAEEEATLSNKKVSALSDHVEKLMLHLKHEVAAKVSVQDQLRRSEKEIEHVKQRNALLLKRNNAREKFLIELKEGSKILEDQLRLMDRRYLELRSKLDWTRHHAQKEVNKAKHTASSLRAKWAMATNSNAGLLDNLKFHKQPPLNHDSADATSPTIHTPKQTQQQHYQYTQSNSPETLDHTDQLLRSPPKKKNSLSASSKKKHMVPAATPQTRFPQSC